MFADLPGESGTDAVIGLDKLFAQGMSGQIAVPEVLQQDHFIGQGGAVGRSGDEAKLSEAFFLGTFLFFRLGGRRRSRQLERDGGYFGDTGEIFGQRGRFSRFTG